MCYTILHLIFICYTFCIVAHLISSSGIHTRVHTCVTHLRLHFAFCTFTQIFCKLINFCVIYMLHLQFIQYFILIPGLLHIYPKPILHLRTQAGISDRWWSLTDDDSVRQLIVWRWQLLIIVFDIVMSVCLLHRYAPLTQYLTVFIIKFPVSKPMIIKWYSQWNINWY